MSAASEPEPEQETLLAAEHFDELPLDSDVEVDDISPHKPERPIHFRWNYLGLVALGGAIGTGAREGLTLAVPAIGAFPLSVFLINTTGSFALGAVLELLRRLGPDEGLRRRLRLLVGTGFMGGYTTYSTFAVGAATALNGGHVPIGVFYGLVSVVIGVAAAFAGVVLAAEVHRTATRGGGR